MQIRALKLTSKVARSRQTFLSFPFCILGSLFFLFSQVLIDITEHRFSSDGPKVLQKLKKPPCPAIEIIDLNDVSEFRPTLKRREKPPHPVSFETDVICLDDENGRPSPVPVSCDRNGSSPSERDSVQTSFRDNSTQRSANISRHFSLKRISSAFEPSNGLPEFFDAQDTNRTRRASTSPPAEKNSDRDERFDSPHSWLDETFSPFSLDSPYYCPSEIDAAVFSDESFILYSDDKDQIYQTCSLNKPEFSYEVGKSVQEKTHVHTLSPHPHTPSQLAPQKLPSSDQAPPPVSPTSTELLAGDSPDTGSDLDMESPPISPVWNFSSTLSPPSHMVLGITDCSVLQASGVDGDGGSDGDGLSERHEEDGQQISLAQFRKLKHVLGGRVEDRVNVFIACFLNNLFSFG